MASRGRRESMFSTPQSSALRGPAAFCWGCLWINQGRGGSPGFSPARRDCGPTTNPRARGPREPRFLHCTGNMGGRRKVQVPLDLAAGCTGGETRALCRGGGAGTITNARASCPGCGVHRQPSGAALRNPAFVSAIGRERRWGRHLLEEKD